MPLMQRFMKFVSRSGILPDARDNSCVPMAARAAGMTYEQLIQSVADIAWRRISGRRLLKAAAA